MSVQSPKEIAMGYKNLIAWNSILARRCAGMMIDTFVIIATMFMPTMFSGGNSDVGVMVWLVFVLAYFPITEGLTGRSLGKLITRTRIVDEKGNNPGIWKAVLRTIPRFIETFPGPLGGLPAFIVVWQSNTRQRWGDKLAKTYVLNYEDTLKLPCNK